MKIAYIEKTFKDESIAKINQANEIIEEYEAQGFKLTLRQLYYQHVARGFIENKERSYKNLGSLISNARLAGLVDWIAIEDRTRFIRRQPHWSTPEEIVNSAAAQYCRDKWRGQEVRVEVWIEKDALISIAESVCNELNVPYFSCRGYVSQSELWEAANRLAGYMNEPGTGTVVVIHLGDHDPSGMDMTRDINDRIFTFTNSTNIQVDRVALNMDQIESFNPPPNPAKIKDARFVAYREQYGEDSWELDALDPTSLSNVIRTAIEVYLDRPLYDEQVAIEESEKEELVEVSESWSDIITYLHNE